MNIYVYFLFWKQIQPDNNTIFKLGFQKKEGKKRKTCTINSFQEQRNTNTLGCYFYIL